MRHSRTHAELSAANVICATLRAIKVVSEMASRGGWGNLAPQVVNWAKAAAADVHRFETGDDAVFDSARTIGTFDRWGALARTAVYAEAFEHTVADINRRILRSRSAIESIS